MEDGSLETIFTVVNGGLLECSGKFVRIEAESAGNVDRKLAAAAGRTVSGDRHLLEKCTSPAGFNRFAHGLQQRNRRTLPSELERDLLTCHQVGDF